MVMSHRYEHTFCMRPFSILPIFVILYWYSFLQRYLFSVYHMCIAITHPPRIKYTKLYVPWCICEHYPFTSTSDITDDPTFKGHDIAFILGSVINWTYDVIVIFRQHVGVLCGVGLLTMYWLAGCDFDLQCICDFMEIGSWNTVVWCFVWLLSLCLLESSAKWQTAWNWCEIIEKSVVT